MWRSSTQTNELMELVTNYVEACSTAGALQVENPAAARRFVFLLAEAPTATAHGTTPLDPAERERIRGWG